MHVSKGRRRPRGRRPGGFPACLGWLLLALGGRPAPAAEQPGDVVAVVRELGRSVRRREQRPAAISGSFVHHTLYSPEGKEREAAGLAQVAPGVQPAARQKALFLGRFFAAEGQIRHDVLAVLGGSNRLGNLYHQNPGIDGAPPRTLDYLRAPEGYPLVSVVEDGERVVRIDHARRAARISQQQRWAAPLRHDLVSKLLMIGPSGELSWADLMLHYTGEEVGLAALKPELTRLTVRRDVVSEGQRCVEVEVVTRAEDASHVGQKRFFVAPELGYAVVRVEDLNWRAKPDSAWVTVYRASDFEARLPARLALPSRTSVSRYYYPEGRPGYWGSSEQTSFSDLRAWDELEPREWSLNIPFGYILDDETLMRRRLAGELEMEQLETAWQEAPQPGEPALLVRPERPQGP